jgi:hypothetical protein
MWVSVSAGLDLDFYMWKTSRSISQRLAMLKHLCRTKALEVEEVVLDLLASQLAESRASCAFDAFVAEKVICWWTDNAWIDWISSFFSRNNIHITHQSPRYRHSSPLQSSPSA